MKDEPSRIYLDFAFWILDDFQKKVFQNIDIISIFIFISIFSIFKLYR